MFTCMLRYQFTAQPCNGVVSRRYRIGAVQCSLLFFFTHNLMNCLEMVVYNQKKW
jgi:hypothetical protein